MVSFTLFSRHLTPAERNYDVGDWELLGGVALEEWRYWLEGIAKPFKVWTDHKNLAYLESAKRLNAWQVTWALFFTCFCFSITYRPGSHKINPDALSHQFSVTDDEQDPAPVLPASCLIRAVTWEIESGSPANWKGPDGPWKWSIRAAFQSCLHLASGTSLCSHLTTFEAFWVFNHRFFLESNVSILFHLFSFICAYVARYSGPLGQCCCAPRSATSTSQTSTELPHRNTPLAKRFGSPHVSSRCVRNPRSSPQTILDLLKS